MRLAVRRSRAHAAATGATLGAIPLGTLFAADGPWNTPLAANAPLHPSSAVWASNLRAQMRWPDGGTSGAWMGFADTTCGHPVYVVPGDTPRIPAWVRNPGNLAVEAHAYELDALLRSGIPLPADWQPSNCTFDRQAVVWQPSTGTLWELQAAKAEADGSVSCDWGGVMLDAATNPGVYRDRYDVRARLWQCKLWGASGTSLPLAAGLITAEDMASGVIAHTMSLAVGQADTDQHLYPAQRHDGLPTATPVPEGARIRFPANVDVDACVARLHIQSVVTAAQRAQVERSLRMMIVAGRDYGFIVTDQTGGGVAIYHREYSVTNGALKWSVMRDGSPTVPIWPFEYHRAMPWDVAQIVDPSVSQGVILE